MDIQQTEIYKRPKDAWNIEENEMSEEYMKLSEKKLKRCWEKYNEGIKLFAEYFNALWW